MALIFSGSVSLKLKIVVKNSAASQTPAKSEVKLIDVSLILIKI